ncbi:MAG TPA: methyltransferase [Sunxiuqinia sp.]|nr:methyltransferase [Sunxiuqinia sp.]
MSLLQIGLIFLCGLPIVATLLLGYQLMRVGNGAMGTPTITSWIFYLAKFIIVVIVGLLFIATIKPQFFLHFPGLIQHEIPEVQKLMALIFLLGANLLVVPAYYGMSIFTRVGLPTGEHALQTNGVYNITRNPMYTSFYFFHVACILLIPSLVLVPLMIFNLVAHHYIILNEEKFLAKTFQNEYLNYKKDTARYL